MFLIIASHFSAHGGFDFAIDTISVNRLWIQCWRTGNIGNNIFILLSGYFLVNSSNIKIGKILKLWGQMFFYSVIIYVIFLGAGLISFNIKGLIRTLCPVTFRKWWFASCYFVLYLISPCINIFLKNLEKQVYRKMLLATTVYWCLIPTFTNQNFESNNLIWFVYIYSLAGYIKLWAEDFTIRRSTCFYLSGLIAFFTVLSVIILDILSLKAPFFAKYTAYFYDKQKLSIFLISLFLFLGFKNSNIAYNKKINTMASAVFGVYLIHENEFIRPFLWGPVFHNAGFSYSPYLIPYSVIVVLLVYTTCTLIELFRIKFIEKKYLKFLERYEPMITSTIEKGIKRICG